MKIPCLTVCQPYAHLIAIGRKRIENRTWNMRYRGTLGIHAGQSRSYLGSYRNGTTFVGMEFGYIIAIVRVAGCATLDGLPHAAKALGMPWLIEEPHREHTEGPYCIIFREVRRLRVPIRCSGKQGLWTVDIPDVNSLDFLPTAPEPPAKPLVLSDLLRQSKGPNE